MPKKIVKFEDPEFGIIYTELEINDDFFETEGFKNVGNESFKEYIELKGGLLLDSIKTFSKGVLKTVKDSKPNELEVKAGMTLKFAEGKLIALFAKAEAEFPIEVTLKWKFNQEDSLNTKS